MLQHQISFVVSLSALCLAFICHCSANNTQFIVGGSAGWIIPPYPTYYANWSHSHFMRVGDSLEFDFDPRFYNLIQVSQYEYEHCTSMEPVREFNSSPAVIPLNDRGVFFFMCSISNYCCLGQKLAISVHEKPPITPPSVSPSPSQSPNGSFPHHPPATSPVTNSSSTPIGGNSPVPSSAEVDDKSNAVALIFWRGFIVFHVFGTFLGFWGVM